MNYCFSYDAHVGMELDVQKAAEQHRGALIHRGRDYCVLSMHATGQWRPTASIQAAASSSTSSSTNSSLPSSSSAQASGNIRDNVFKVGATKAKGRADQLVCVHPSDHQGINHSIMLDARLLLLLWLPSAGHATPWLLGGFQGETFFSLTSQPWKGLGRHSIQHATEHAYMEK